MLWNLVDVLVILVAVGALLLLGPDVIGFKKWRHRLTGRPRDEAEES